MNALFEFSKMFAGRQASSAAGGSAVLAEQVDELVSKCIRNIVRAPDAGRIVTPYR